MSAGALSTPKLLQLSGVGPADHLRSVGITPIVDSPRVGWGLTDHPHAWATWSLAPGFVGLSDMTNPKWLLQWVIRRGGKLANSGVEAVAHIRSTADLPACDFQLMIVPADALADPKSRQAQARVVGWAFILDAQESGKRHDSLIGSGDAAGHPVEPAHRARGRRRLDPGGRTHARDHRDRPARIRRRARTPSRPWGGRRGVHQGHRDHDVSLVLQCRNGRATPTAHSTRSFACAVSRTCASPTRPRCLVSPRANTNAPSIMIGERCADFLLGR